MNPVENPCGICLEPMTDDPRNPTITYAEAPAALDPLHIKCIRALALYHLAQGHSDFPWPTLPSKRVNTQSVLESTDPQRMRREAEFNRQVELGINGLIYGSTTAASAIALSANNRPANMAAIASLAALGSIAHDGLATNARPLIHYMLLGIGISRFASTRTTRILSALMTFITAALLINGCRIYGPDQDIVAVIANGARQPIDTRGRLGMNSQYGTYGEKIVRIIFMMQIFRLGIGRF